MWATSQAEDVKGKVHAHDGILFWHQITTIHSETLRVRERQTERDSTIHILSICVKRTYRGISYTKKKKMSLPIHHVYILISILIPVACVCLFASYMIFLYDHETGRRLPQMTSRSSIKPVISPPSDRDDKNGPQSVYIYHPDHRQLSLGTIEIAQDGIVWGTQTAVYVWMWMWMCVKQQQYNTSQNHVTWRCKKNINVILWSLFGYWTVLFTENSMLFIDIYYIV